MLTFENQFPMDKKAWRQTYLDEVSCGIDDEAPSRQKDFFGTREFNQELDANNYTQNGNDGWFQIKTHQL